MTAIVTPTPTATQSNGGRTVIDEAIAEIGAATDARSVELYSGRRLPDDLYRAVATAGLFRQLVPREFGLERTPVEWFRAGLELARHDPSLGWVVTQGAAELGWIASGADERWAREVLDDPLAASASSTAGIGSITAGGDLSRFGGRWTLNTGCHGATWIGGLAVVRGATGADGMPVVRWGWVPAGRAEIVEDWDPSGLHGTGSHSTVVPEQDVPTSWTFDPFSPTTNDRGPNRCLVGNGNWPIAGSVAATQLGNARRALDEATAVVLTKAPMPDFTLLAGNAAVQRGLVAAEARWQAALASVERELESMWDEALALQELTTGQRIPLHRANVEASHAAVQIVDAACELTGTASVARRHPLSRCRRDVDALQNHISVGASSIEHNAKVALGLELQHRLV